MVLNIRILRSGVMQLVFINECNSCEIINQMFFNVMFSFWKTKDNGYGKYCKIKLLSGALSHDASNESEAYLEPVNSLMTASY